MVNKFVNYFSRISPLSEEEAAGIEAGMDVRTYKKGTLLLKTGQQSVDTYFILQGCIREFVETDGEEKTTAFFTEEQWVISLSNFSGPAPAGHNLICMEDCTLVVGNEQSARKMFQTFPRFETISRAVMEMHFSEQKKVLTSFVTDSPEQRYLYLIQTRPDLVQRVPQYHIASYIGVKPESLSRIRKKLTNRKI